MSSKAAPKPAPYIPDENDVVSDILRLVISMAPAFGIAIEAQAALAEKVNAEARDRWGGDRSYIQRVGGRSQRNESIKREHRAGERVPYLARKYQLTERRIIQILEA